MEVWLIEPRAASLVGDPAISHSAKLLIRSLTSQSGPKVLVRSFSRACPISIIFLEILPWHIACRFQLARAFAHYPWSQSEAKQITTHFCD